MVRDSILSLQDPKGLCQGWHLQDLCELDKQLNVLFVIPSLGHGGAQKVLVNLCGNLLQKHVLPPGTGAAVQFNITILTFADEQAIPCFYKPPEGVTLVTTNTYRKYRPRLGRALILPLQLRLAIKNLKADVVVSFLDIANFPVILSAVLLPVRVIVSERQDTTHYSFAKVRKVLRSFLYPRADCVVVQTNLIRDQMPLSANVKVIPNACPQFKKAAKPAVATNGVYRAVAVGRLENQKNIEFLVRACSSIFSGCDNWILDIYGSGSLQAALEKQIEDANLANYVFLRGATTDIETVLSDSNLFLFPSLYEGFPNALAEAASAGLPAVAFDDVSGVPELINDGKNGVLLRRQNTSEIDFANVVVSLMKKHELRSEMGTESKKISDRYLPNSIHNEWCIVIAPVH